jgi:hypothetical protein
MSALETVVEELKTLPPKKLAAAADYVHRLKETSRAERSRALDRAHGSLTGAEADALAAAIHDNCERIDAGQW